MSCIKEMKAAGSLDATALKLNMFCLLQTFRMHAEKNSFHMLDQVKSTNVFKVYNTDSLCRMTRKVGQQENVCPTNMRKNINYVRYGEAFIALCC